ncbi:immunoglobulin superfamily member 11 [Electrophorus electricus]|uniref:immunoglobulin superfamily member 11 n=1 Tax=Electrophorus electricus TaxID=8005 RepID=UPI0015CFCC26|nr:immunoglobulin superfamily member 11 [Electrophorus electricus]
MACSRWLLTLACLASAYLQYGSVRVTVMESSLQVVQGDSVTLPCSFLSWIPLIRLSIIWTVTPFSDPDSPTQVIMLNQGQVVESPAFTGRVEFAAVPWSADITLNDARVSDAGFYRCVVSNPPETGDPGIGELSLSVLVPPSLPVCLWEGNTDVGGSVTLSCIAVEGVPTPHISWEKLDPDRITLPVNMEGELMGSVKIVNMSAQNAGVYRCSAMNLLGTQNCYVNLPVSTPPDNYPGLLQGVLVTLSMALILLALLVLVLWLHRLAQESKWTHGREEEECFSEIRHIPPLVKRSFV